MISIEDLKFKYKNNSFAVNIDKLLINRGESIAVCGPSGSGKSTFLNLVSGEIKPQTGELFFNNLKYSSLSESNKKKQRLNKFGLIFQQPRLVDWMSVKDNILLPLKLSTVRLKTEDRLNKLVDELELTGLLCKDAGKLSLGEQMRVSIVRALIKKPELILADEPTASLDTKLRKKVTDLLVKEAEESNSTLILVTHDDYVISQMNKYLSSESWGFT